MKKPILQLTLAGLMGLLVAPECLAQEASQTWPLRQGPYVSLIGTYLMPEGDGLKATPTGTIAAGFRRDWYAVEFGGSFEHMKTRDGGGFVQYGGSINGLVFPFTNADHHFLRGLYGVVEFGGQQNRNYPSSAGPQKFLTITYAGGLGNLLPFSFGRYEFALRTEALYRYANRAAAVNEPNGDIPVPGYFRTLVINVGLQLPLGLKPRPVPVTPEPAAAVVPAEETLPPPPPPPPAPPPPPPCKTPAPGEKISLAGCGTGDMIVLHGVNFEFNKATLTPNAKTILDNVGEELVTYPAIKVEIDGHTDGKGSASYNQRLSQRRADAARDYLVSKGVAAERMTAEGFGASQPVASNDTDEGRELNRRVALKIVAGTATPAGAAPAPAGPAAPGAAAAPTSAPAGDATPASPPAPPKSDSSDLDFLKDDGSQSHKK